MSDKVQKGTVTNAELVADDPGLTREPTPIVLEQVNPVQPDIVKEAEEKASKAKK